MNFNSVRSPSYCGLLFFSDDEGLDERIQSDRFARQTMLQPVLKLVGENATPVGIGRLSESKCQ